MTARPDQTPRHIRRNAAEAIEAALSASPVVLLQGPRQSGKSTLARMLVAAGRLDHYVTLDDIEPLEFATRHPDAFVDSLRGRVVLDEIQRAPGLMRAIKASVDRDRTAGRFLLTGSADILLLPKVSETLAGRMRIVDLWTFSQDELAGHRSRFIDACFSDGPLVAPASCESRDDIVQRMLRGGYPAAITAASDHDRDAWFDSHVRTLITRTVPDIANIDGLTDLPRLLRIVAARTSALANNADLSRSVGLPQTTLKRYLGILQAAFVIRSTPAWTAGVGRRLIRAPRLWLTDTGFAASLMRIDAARLEFEPALLGALLETFAGMELVRLAGWSRTRADLHPFRSTAGHEVDLVLEGPAGSIVGIEVKAATRASLSYAHGLAALAEASGRRFHRGIVLYTGTESRPLGPRFDLLPISALWTL